MPEKSGMRLPGKVAFITGAGMGQGREAAILFADQGARVIVADINADAGSETAETINKTHKDAALFVHGDVGREQDVRRMIETGVQKFHQLHILYNNAGVLWKDRDKSVTDTTEEQWDRVMAINLKGTFFTCKYGIPELIKSGGGSIINIGSVSALLGFELPQDAYTASKGALISLTKSLAIQFAKNNIRANIIHPGIVDTPMQARYISDSQIRDSFIQSIPLRRLGTVRDIAYLALYLASDESSYMTGAELVIDGGFTAQ